MGFRTLEMGGGMGDRMYESVVVEAGIPDDTVSGIRVVWEFAFGRIDVLVRSAACVAADTDAVLGSAVLDDCCCCRVKLDGGDSDLAL